MPTTRGLLLSLSAVGTLAAGWLLLGGSGSPTQRSNAPATTPVPEQRAPAVEPQDPEALASWFQDAVLREFPAPQDEGRAWPARANRSARRDNSSARERAAAVDPDLARRANWTYLEDVFAGRVSGIPNERKAGISLAEMTRLGDVPHVQTLRREGRLEELNDLGLGPSAALEPEAPGTAAPDEYRIVHFPLNPRLEPAH